MKNLLLFLSLILISLTNLYGQAECMPALELRYLDNPPSCDDQSQGTVNDGSISVIVQNPVSGVVYDFMGPGTITIISDTEAEYSDLAVGNFTMTVTDPSQNCYTELIVDLTGPDPLTLDINDFELDCFGDDSGELTADVDGGTVNSDYDYDWSNGGNTETINNLSAGTYTVTVMDDNGCSIIGTGEVLEPDELTCSIETVENSSCDSNNPNGLLTVTAVGGTPFNSFSYNLDWDGPNNQSGSVMMMGSTYMLSGLIDGSYTVTVTDVNDCESYCENIITQSNLMACAITATSNVTNCTTNNGEITVEVTGGGQDYSYIWTSGSITGAGMSTNDVFTVTGLPAGPISIVITDNTNSCESSCSTIIGNNVSSITCVATPSPVTSCVLSNGSIQIDVSGAAPSTSFNLSWTGPNSTSGSLSGTTPLIITGLDAGSYTISITNPTDGCTTSCTANVISSSSNISCTTTTSPVTSCTSPNGSVNVQVSGVTTNVNLAWTGPNNTSGSQSGSGTIQITGLGEGSYNITVSNPLDGCSSSCSATINSQLSIPAITNVNPISPTNCINQNGSFSINYSPSGSVNFSWTRLDDMQTAGPINSTSSPYNTGSNFAAGTYEWVITNLQGCSDTIVSVLAVPAGPSAQIQGDNNVCQGESSELNIQTNSTLEGVVWQSSNTNIATVTNSGSYTGVAPGTTSISATVTDDNLCSTTSTINVTVISPPGSPIGNPIMDICEPINGNPAIPTLSVSPTSGASRYIWRNNGVVVQNGASTSYQPQAVVLGLNQYTIQVENAAGCLSAGTATISFMVNPRPELPIVLQPASICLGATAFLSATNIAAGTQALWYASPTDQNLLHTGNSYQPTPNQSGSITYYVAARNTSTGCVSVSREMVTLQVNAAVMPTIASNVQDATICPGQQSAELSIVQGYDEYEWEGPGGFSANQEVVNAMLAGEYRITVTDSNDCENTSTYTINHHELPELNPTSNIPCDGQEALVINPQVSGGQAGYTINYVSPPGSPSTTTGTIPNATSATAGTWTIGVTDANGCTDQDNLVTQVHSLPPVNFDYFFSSSVPVEEQTPNSNNNMRLEILSNIQPEFTYTYNFSPAIEDLDGNVLSTVVISNPSDRFGFKFPTDQRYRVELVVTNSITGCTNISVWEGDVINLSNCSMVTLSPELDTICSDISQEVIFEFRASQGEQIDPSSGVWRIDGVVQNSNSAGFEFGDDFGNNQNFPGRVSASLSRTVPGTYTIEFCANDDVSCTACKDIDVLVINPLDFNDSFVELYVNGTPHIGQEICNIDTVELIYSNIDFIDLVTVGVSVNGTDLSSDVVYSGFKRRIDLQEGNNVIEITSAEYSLIQGCGDQSELPTFSVVVENCLDPGIISVNDDTEGEVFLCDGDDLSINLIEGLEIDSFLNFVVITEDIGDPNAHVGPDAKKLEIPYEGTANDFLLENGLEINQPFFLRGFSIRGSSIDQVFTQSQSGFYSGFTEMTIYGSPKITSTEITSNSGHDLQSLCINDENIPLHYNLTLYDELTSVSINESNWNSSDTTFYSPLRTSVGYSDLGVEGNSFSLDSEVSFNFLNHSCSSQSESILIFDAGIAPDISNADIIWWPGNILALRGLDASDYSCVKWGYYENVETGPIMTEGIEADSDEIQFAYCKGRAGKLLGDLLLNAGNSTFFADVYTEASCEGCSNRIYLDRTAIPAIDFREAEYENELHIYPNPARDILTFELEGFQTGEYSYFVSDMVGKSVMENVFEKDSFVSTRVIDISKLNAGTYLLQVMGEDGYARVQKIIIL